MRKLALSDEILMTVEKPARYIGGEVNAVMKDKRSGATFVLLCVSLMCMRSECPIWVFRFYTICLTGEKICGVNVYIHRGQICIRVLKERTDSAVCTGIPGSD